MRYTLIFALLLGGCSSVSIGKPWPLQEDAYLLQTCSSLLIIENAQQTSMAQVVDVVEANYSKWHECKIKTDAWIKWYNQHWKNKDR